MLLSSKSNDCAIIEKAGALLKIWEESKKNRKKEIERNEKGTAQDSDLGFVYVGGGS